MQPRQNAQLTLAAAAGDQYRITVASSDLGLYDQGLAVFAPDGTQVVDAWGGDGLDRTFTTNQGGNYRIVLDPTDDHAGTQQVRVQIQ